MRKLLYVVFLIAGAIVLYLVYTKWPTPERARGELESAVSAEA